MLSMKDRIPFCPHGSCGDIDRGLILALEKMERDHGLELEFSSGFRCKECNTKAGGSKNSAHLRGLAVDILADTSAERFLLVSAAVRLGFSRIGVAKGFVHLDVDTSLPNFMMWLY